MAAIFKMADNHIFSHVTSWKPCELQDVWVHSCLSPEASVYIYSLVIRSSLIYGCDSIWINKSNMIKLDSTQGKIIKKILGLPYTSHTTPLIQALGILPCSVSIIQVGIW